MTRPSLIDLKLAYTRNENITRILRESAESAVNDQSAILIAYDFQAGSYVQALDDPTHRSLVEKYTDAIHPPAATSHLGGDRARPGDRID